MPTNNLLATGGMKQQGGTTDPVSGNAVPVGSLQNEVRDDVDAKLSDGEFVFPADVTRYIGLDKLMQIREAAKQGLQKMDSMGQMGNSEEVEEGASSEEFSSNIDDIISTIDEDGGDKEVKKFAGGGGVNTTSYSGAPLQGFSMELYEDPKTKITRYIPFLNGKALLPVPAGYTKKDVSAPAPAPTETTTTTTPIDTTTRTGGGGGASREAGSEGTLGTGDAAASEGFGGLQSGTTGLGKLASMVPGKLGLLISWSNNLYTKVQNEKAAAANAKAVDASALSSMGFSANSIKAAQEAAAKATLEGKSAKEIAVAAANAASTGTAMGEPKDSFDALMGITNAFNSMTNEQAKENAKELNVTKSLQEAGLEGQVPSDMMNVVVDGINNGLTAREAVQKAVSMSNVAIATNQQEARDKADAQAEADARIAEAAKQQEVRDAKEAKDALDAAAAREAVAEAAVSLSNDKNRFSGDRESGGSSAGTAARTGGGFGGTGSGISRDGGYGGDSGGSDAGTAARTGGGFGGTGSGVGGDGGGGAATGGFGGDASGGGDRGTRGGF